MTPDLVVCVTGGSHAASAALATVTSAWAAEADYARGPDRASGPLGLSPEALGQIAHLQLFLVFQFLNSFSNINFREFV
jgi:hypothetical protein